MSTETISTAVTGQNLRVLLADDHPAFLAGLNALLRTMPRTEVVGEAATGSAAIAETHRLKPDIVMMDVNMPSVNGIEATKAIVSRHQSTAVLILTMAHDSDSVLACVRAGARGYLLKGAGLDDIRRAIEAVSSGDMIFGAQVAGHVYEHLTRPPAQQVPFPNLTDRERAVLELVADGRGNAAIAHELGLSIKTVRNYLSRILNKLQVSDRTQASVRARRAGLGH
jgi:DNA-binding NarL/FixJ family response regulator